MKVKYHKDKDKIIIDTIYHEKKSLFGNDVVEFLDNLNRQYKEKDKNIRKILNETRH